MVEQYQVSHFFQNKIWVDELLNHDEKIIYEDVISDGTVIGCILAVRKKINMLPFNYLRITFGPDIDYNSIEIVEKVFRKVIEIAKKQDSVYVQINPFTWGKKNEKIIDLLTQNNFKKTRRYVYEATIMLDLSKSEEELLKGFERRGREAVRQSERRGITSSQVEMNVENLELFYVMYADTCKRSGMVADDKEKIIKWSVYFSMRNMAYLFFAQYENIPVCGFLAFKCGNCLSLIYQGSDYSGDLPNRRPANNLYWSTIRWAKHHGYKWFDLAGVTLNPPKGSKSEGILLYKRQFGGELCVLPGNFEYVHRPFVKFILDIITPLYSKVALFLLRRKRMQGV